VDDKNVSPIEMVNYVRTQTGLQALTRFGGDLDTLKRLIAAGFPVIIEESFHFEEPYWPNDDLWAAHYNLLTGYDDAAGTFTGQDSFYGADQVFEYEALDEAWQIFNRVYIVIYRPDQEETLKAILGEDWDVDANREKALELSLAEAEANPDNAFAWFSAGTNLVYFERYAEATQAYDRARELGLPQRMLRYQFGPFFAYFHTGRIDDLMTLTEYALQRTPNAEEALLWRGWGLYRQGKTAEAIASFRRALEENPNYLDAQYALDFVQENS